MGYREAVLLLDRIDDALVTADESTPTDAAHVCGRGVTALSFRAAEAEDAPWEPGMPINLELPDDPERDLEATHPRDIQPDPWPGGDAMVMTFRAFDGKEHLW